MFTLLSTLTVVQAQTPVPSTTVTPEITLNRGMWALNSWAVANMATGIGMSIMTDEPTQKAFHQMNVGWNVVNLGLASLPLINKPTVDAERWSRLFWINAGLDVGYVAAGWYMANRGRQEGNPQMEGMGNSLMLQGGFLVGFDAVMGWRMQGYLR